MPYGWEGRQAIVYALTLTPWPGGHPPLPLPTLGEGEGGRGEWVRAKSALKVFKPRYRVPALVTLADRIAARTAFSTFWGRGVGRVEALPQRVTARSAVAGWGFGEQVERYPIIKKQRRH